MTTLTLIYAADKEGNFTNPKTGECWEIPADRELFRETIKDRAIICGTRTLFKDWRGLQGARCVRFCTREGNNNLLPKDHFEQTQLYAMRESEKSLGYGDTPLFFSRKVFYGGKPLQTLAAICFDAGISWCPKDKRDEIFCVGGKETIESFAPFASRVLVTLPEQEFYPLNCWLPPFIKNEETEWRNDIKDSVCFKSDMPGHKILGWRYDFRRLQSIELK